MSKITDWIDTTNVQHAILGETSQRLSRLMFLTREAGADLVGRGWIRESLLNKMKVIVIIMEEIKANTKERYVCFIVISTFWPWHYFWCNSFQLDSKSQIAPFWGCPIDSATPRHQPLPPPPPPRKIIYPPLRRNRKL